MTTTTPRLAAVAISQGCADNEATWFRCGIIAKEAMAVGSDEEEAIDDNVRTQ